MSGTSLDGIDAALVRTDGETVAALGPARTAPYEPGLREHLRAALGGRGPLDEVAAEVTRAHAAAVTALLVSADAPIPAVIGFHGHTVMHDPATRRTWQLGDGALLARLTGIDVVNDFRAADVAAGGEGAPLAPLYHAALGRPLDRPLAVLNIGGVANLTWIGADGASAPALLAFDTGPGGALIDDWVRAHTGRAYDADGVLAAAGRIDAGSLDALLAHPYFERPPPKSLDRNAFALDPLKGLSATDGAATLTAFTAVAAARAAAHFPAPVGRWLVTGGGRHNGVLMAALADHLGLPVEPVEAVGWQGDVLEAQAFAFLAVRSCRGLPLSLPTTTGVPRPLTGGRLHRAPARD